MLGTGVRHQVGGGLPAGRLRAAGLVWSAGARRSFGVRCRAALRSVVVDGIPAFVQRRAGRADRLRRHLDRLAAARRQVREGPLLDAVHASTPARPLRRQERTSPTTTRQQRPRWPTASEPDASGARRGRPVAAVALVLPPRRLHVPHALPELLHAHLRRPSRRAGCCSTARSASTRDTEHPARHPGLRRPDGQRLPAQVLLLGTPALWWGGCLAAARRGRRCGSARATGGTASRWSARCRPGCRGCSTTTGRSSASTRSSPSRSWSWPSTLLMGRMLGTLDARRPRGARAGVIVSGAVLRARAAELRVVLADLHRPAAHPPRVAGPDLVHPLDLVTRSEN